MLKDDIMREVVRWSIYRVAKTPFPRPSLAYLTSTHDDDDDDDDDGKEAPSLRLLGVLELLVDVVVVDVEEQRLTKLL
jgi:hypothetical protein